MESRKLVNLIQDTCPMQNVKLSIALELENVKKIINKLINSGEFFEQNPCSHIL